MLRRRRRRRRRRSRSQKAVKALKRPYFAPSSKDAVFDICALR
jgi:hypothetical protein